MTDNSPMLHQEPDNAPGLSREWAKKRIRTLALIILESPELVSIFRQSFADFNEFVVNSAEEASINDFRQQITDRGGETYSMFRDDYDDDYLDYKD